jgi:hypothetical protein
MESKKPAWLFDPAGRLYRLLVVILVCQTVLLFIFLMQLAALNQDVQRVFLDTRGVVIVRSY